VDVPVSVGCATAGTTTVTPTGSSGGTATDAGIAPTPGSIVDGGSAPTEDAGVLPGGWISDDGGCGYEEDAGSWSGYDGGAASLCSPCPAGWEPPAAGGQPELCCQSAPGGGQLCFSQATGSASGEAEDGGSAPPITGVSTPGNAGWGTAGASTDDGGSAGPSCSGSSSSCSCESSANGHSYALDCYASSSGAITCSCTIDGVATSSTPSVDSCNDSTAVENAFSQASGCGFP